MASIFQVTAAKATATAMKTDVDPHEAFLKSLKMEEYDDEEDGAGVFLGGAGLAMYASNADVRPSFSYFSLPTPCYFTLFCLNLFIQRKHISTMFVE
jgi:hypothetical protein